MEGLKIELVLCLLAHGAQVRSQRRLSNSLGVIVIVLLSLHERLHIDRRDDPRLVAQLTQGPADKMCAEASSDHTRWQPFKGIHERQPLDLTAKGNLAVGAKTHNVEDFLADVDADRGHRFS